jgi:uncharacterized protein (TIGR02145 family)
MKRVSTVLMGIVILAMAATSFAGDCGDVNNDGNYNILDIVHLINDQYKNGPDPICLPNIGTVTDIDGNIYYTFEIGNQWWMMENLKVTHYRNGDPIPNVTGNTEWVGLTTGAYCNYNNDVANAATYGRLYNWYSADDSRNIAPAGWHIPSDAEWQTLVNYLGGAGVAGGKMKESGTTHWSGPNTGATNESGFSALPGGYRRSGDGVCVGVGFATGFWSSTESGSKVWFRYLSYDYSGVVHFDNYKPYGYSVRCVKD